MRLALACIIADAAMRCIYSYSLRSTSLQVSRSGFFSSSTPSSENTIIASKHLVPFELRAQVSKREKSARQFNLELLKECVRIGMLTFHSTKTNRKLTHHRPAHWTPMSGIILPGSTTLLQQDHPIYRRHGEPTLTGPRQTDQDFPQQLKLGSLTLVKFLFLQVASVF